MKNSTCAIVFLKMKVSASFTPPCRLFVLADGNAAVLADEGEGVGLEGEGALPQKIARFSGDPSTRLEGVGVGTRPTPVRETEGKGAVR
jgi:hypothetical protein